MTTSALIMMILVQVSVTIITIYFFVKVLKTPKREEPDSFTDNDDDLI
jgi:heme/copper-type cytochrome/quinol oxidase subunit 2